MPYVVMATTGDARAKWLTEPRMGGHRTFAGRESAERFESESAAKRAILVMIDEEKCEGIAFSVEALDMPHSEPGDDVRRRA
jgi:hypothetical protein